MGKALQKQTARQSPLRVLAQELLRRLVKLEIFHTKYMRRAVPAETEQSEERFQKP